MAMREFLNLSGIPFTKEGIYATNNQFQKAGPKGFIHFKVLQNDKLYLHVDLPGVPDDRVRHRVDAVRKKLVLFSGKTPDGNQREGVREYSGSTGLGCDCCEITGVDAKMKDGVLRMIVSRVKVKDHDKKCTNFVPLNAGKSGRHLEENPFLVRGRKGAFVGVPLPDDGLYFAVDIPGVCCDDVEVLANEHEVRFYAEVKNVHEHDESGRVYLGCVNSRSSSSAPPPSILTQNIAYDAEFGVLKIVIAPRNYKTSE
ncbi:Heat shock protein HSP20/alpha crystallin family [Hirschfeldia incana]|nr:Heat shock protein HSP20/alpha crystallin family [Hirschfeldia incana]